MKYKRIERGMVLQDVDGNFVIVRDLGRGINKSDVAGWYMLAECLDLHEDLTFEPSEDTFYESAFAAESFYSYVGRWRSDET